LRILRPGQLIRDRDATLSLVDEAPAIAPPDDHPAAEETVQDRVWPERVVAQGVEDEEVAVEGIHVHELGAGRLGHANAVAAAGRRRAQADAVEEIGRDVAIHEGTVGLEAAVGEDDGLGTHRFAAARPFLDHDPGHPPPLSKQLDDPPAVENAPPTGRQRPAQPLQRQVRPFPFPGDAATVEAWRVEQVFAMGRVAVRAQVNAGRRQPFHRRPRARGESGDHARPAGAVRFGRQLRGDRLGRPVRAEERRVEGAAAPERVREPGRRLRLLQQDDVQAQFGGAQGRRAAGDAAADHDQIGGLGQGLFRGLIGHFDGSPWSGMGVCGGELSADSRERIERMIGTDFRAQARG
jgi:hypothetical protein